MTNQEFTLAYTKSPKTSKRTTFQDELQAAVSARAGKVIDQCSGDFNDEEDDFLNELLKSRKQKVDAFKTRKAKIVNFEFLDDADKPSKSKRVSFLKTQRNYPPLEGTQTDEQHKTAHSTYSLDSSGSLSSRHSTNLSDQSFDKKSDVESTHSQDTQGSTNRSVSQLSEDALQDMPPSLQSDIKEETPDTMGAGLSGTPSNLKQSAEKTLPTPKPRQRILGVTNHPEKQFGFQDLSLQPALSTESKCHPNLPEGGPEQTISQSLSSVGERSVSELSKSTVDSGSKDGINTEDCTGHASFEELTSSQPSATVEDLGDTLDGSTVQLNSHISDSNSGNLPTSGSNTKDSQKPRSVYTKRVESKYLGSLQILDRNFSNQCSEEGQVADTLRAAVYQEWLKKKKEKLKLSMEIKLKEQLIKEKKKEEQESKKEDAVASYEAWKEKKLESLKMKMKEKQEKIRKEQRAQEEKEEKKQTAKQIFEQWKHERDRHLKEKYRKARKSETEERLQKQEKEEERKRSSSSAFSEWSEKKNCILHERSIVKRKELKDNAETERYIKEEKEKMALDMYESWLARKNQEKKRLKEEKWLQGILVDSPPPPWSPPNKTIPRGK